jgi:hypothetical protein
VNRSLLVPLAAVVTLGLSGCAGVTLTQTWRDPNYPSRPVTRVFILSTAPGNAQAAQFENAIAQAFTAKGFQAATAASVFPPGRLDKRKVQEYVNGNGVDLLVMVHLTTEKAAPVVVNTTVAQSSGWYGGYGSAASTSTTIAQGTDVMARIDVFDVRTDPDTLIWRGESNEVDLQGAAKSMAGALTDALVKAKILVK